MLAFVNAILEPWSLPSLEVYWPVIVQGMLVSLALGLIGCFLVVRGISLLGDALSHSVLPGIVVGFLIGGSLHSPWILVGATLMGLLAATLVQSVHTQSRVKEDASLGIVFTALFALGVVMINRYAGQADLDPGCVLYGNIEAFILDPGAIRPMALTLIGIVALLVVFYRQLLVSAFDPALAVSLGVRAGLVHYALMGVLSLTVVTSFEAVGAILAVALLIMPGATARLWTDRMPAMLAIACGHAVVSTLLGYWLSHRAVVNTSASGAISVAGFVLFLLSWLFSPNAGLVTRMVSRRKLAQMIATENLLKTIGEMADRAGGRAVPEAALAAELHVSPSSLAPRLSRAFRAGWLKRGSRGGDVSLTAEGEAQSARLTRAHLLWEQYLQEQMGIAPDHVHDAAEWIEHHLTQEKLDRLDELLKKPRDEAPPPPAHAH
jgi:ABC-type Mn2+/Zn2+ transport system permease subunit/Mn-dependent DtxR family transcriptional regulator